MANAAAEAADCIANRGGHYFRRFAVRRGPRIEIGERVYYVEDGYIRGFALVSHVKAHSKFVRCETTEKLWAPGAYVFMDATSWKWIRPISMRGFQGFRYAKGGRLSTGIEYLTIGNIDFSVHVVGDWLDPKPSVHCSLTIDHK